MKTSTRFLDTLQNVLLIPRYTREFYTFVNEIQT